MSFLVFWVFWEPKKPGVGNKIDWMIWSLESELDIDILHSSGVNISQFHNRKVCFD